MKTDEQLMAEASFGGSLRSKWQIMTPINRSDVGIHIEWQLWHQIETMPHFRVRGTVHQTPSLFLQGV
jgi:hypothetical protein